MNFDTHFTIKISTTERHGLMVSSTASYFRSPGSKSRQRVRLFWLRVIVIFLSIFRQILEQCIKIDHDLFMLHIFQITMHYIPTMYVKSVVE